jgi:diguanylate cyclase (GGDEF)-like protein
MSRVLIVDDRALNREFLASLLGHLGHTLQEACDGREALDAVQKEAPDLIITDIVMPRMNGLEFIEEMQRDQRHVDVPVIFYSATYRIPEARVMVRACHPAAVVIPKPSDPEVIIAAVQAALGQPSAMPVPQQIQGWRNTTLIALMDFQCALSEERDAAAVLELAIRAAPNLIAADYAALGLEFPDTGVLTQVLVHGLDPLGTFTTSTCITPAFASRLADPTLHRGWSSTLKSDYFGLPATHPPVRSLLTVPLSGTRACYGWIYLANRSDGLPFTAADEELLVLLAQQVTTAYEHNILVELAARDALTGLQNRGEFDAALKREYLRAQRKSGSLALVMIDIDFFKKLNDQYGHAAGDMVLHNLALEFSKSVRGYDQVFRFGGEEFVLLLPGAHVDDALLRAEQIRLAVKALDLHYDGQALGPVNLSLGVAAYPEHDGGIEELFRAADGALYAAKDQGRDRTCAAVQRKKN